LLPRASSGKAALAQSPELEPEPELPAHKGIHERIEPLSRPIHSSASRNLNQNRNRNRIAAMKSKQRILGAIAATLLAVILSGCAGFWDPLPGSSGGTGTNPASGIFYVLNQKTDQIAGFSFTADTTTPTAVSGSPYALSITPFALAISPSDSFLYVSTTVGIYLYTINSDSSLTIANNGQPISSDPAYTMQVDPSGSWLVEAVSGTGTLSAIPITSTGTYSGATVESVSLPSTTAQQLTISPSGSTYPYVFVAMGTDGTAVIPFNSANTDPFGAISTVSVKHSLAGDNTVAVDPQNRLLYVGETAAVSATQSGGLRVFTIGSSGITEISGSPYSSGGTGPAAILATSSYVYVANSAVSGSSTGNITAFSLSTTSSPYSLSSLGAVSAGSQTTALAEDSTGSYLLAVNYGGSPDLSAFTFDTTTAGTLDAGPTAATGTDPVGAWAIVAAP
jgi:6-phosphogluconolactonase (cycloisomerase 2 family)